MAPEQAMAKSDEIDAQSDLWAAGATMFALASGHLVHDADNAQQILIKAATSPARSLATVLPTAPRALCAIVDRALAFEKADRWANAVAMREALREASIALFAAVPTPEKIAEMVEEAQEAATGVSIPTGEHSVPIRPPGTTTAPSRSREAGAMTTDGVSTESLITRGGARRSPGTVVAAAGIGSVVGIGLVFMLLRGTMEPTATATAAAAPIPTPTATATATSIAIAPVPDPGAAVPVDQLPMVRMDPAVAAPRPKPAASAAGSVSAAPPTAAAPAKPSCTPPYDFDSKGNKRWKRDCF